MPSRGSFFARVRAPAILLWMSAFRLLPDLLTCARRLCASSLRHAASVRPPLGLALFKRLPGCLSTRVPSAPCARPPRRCRRHTPCREGLLARMGVYADAGPPVHACIPGPGRFLAPVRSFRRKALFDPFFSPSRTVRSRPLPPPPLPAPALSARRPSPVPAEARAETAPRTRGPRTAAPHPTARGSKSQARCRR